MGATVGVVGPIGGGEMWATADSQPQRTPADHRILDVIGSDKFQNASPSERREMLKDVMRDMSEDELRGLTTTNPQYLAIRDEVLNEKTSDDDDI